MPREFFILRFLPLILGVLTTFQPVWSFREVSSKHRAFPHQRLGPSSLAPNDKVFGPEIAPEVLADLERLRSQKNNESIAVEFSPRSGVSHSVAYMKMEVPGDSLEEKARIFLADYSNLFLKGRSTGELVHEKTRIDSFGAGHVDFLQYHEGLRVYGAALSVHFDSEENLVMVNGEFIPDLTLSNGNAKSVSLSEREALRKALRRLGPFPWKALEEGELCIYSRFPTKGAHHLAYRYDLIGQGFDSHHILFADAVDGGVLAFFPTAAYFDGSAAVFDPNPTQSGVVQRTLTDLDDSGLLRGPLITVLDEENPRVKSPNRTFNLNPNTEAFNQTSVYYYLTETRKRMRELGFDDQSAGTIPAITNAKDKQTGGEFNNAFFSFLSQGFVFGNGDGNVFQNLSRDFDVAAHEYGHFFDNFLINTEQTPPHTPRRSWGEAAGDTLAVIMLGDPNVGESTIPGEPFLRTVANTKRFPNDLANEEHLDGEIFGGANWDFMKLHGGGSVNLAAREEMARVMMAGIPHIAPANVQFNDILKAFVQGDMNRGGANVANLRQAYSMHGITEGGIQKIHEDRIKSEEPTSAKQLAGFQEIFDNIPVSGFLSDGFFADFYIRIPAGAAKLTVQTFIPGFFNQGDVILYAAPSDFTGPNEVYFSDVDFIPEVIEITNDSPIPLNRDSVWLIEVADIFDFTFSEVGLVATIEGGDGRVTQIFLNVPIEGRIASPEAQDLYVLEANAGQFIDVSAVKRGDNLLDPLVMIGNNLGQLLAFDDDSGGNENALISNFQIPSSGNYLIAVQSAITAQGPISFGDYRLQVTGASGPGPTPTPIPTPIPGGVPTLTPGVPRSGSIAASNVQAGAVSQSEALRVVVPNGVREMVIEARETPNAAGSIILQVRKGAPVGNTLDDYVGLGNRKSTVLVTPDSRVPLTPGEYFLLIFNLSSSPVDYQVTATFDTGGGGPTTDFDSDMNGKINAVDLVALMGSNPQDLKVFFEFATQWGGGTKEAGK